MLVKCLSEHIINRLTGISALLEVLDYKELIQSDEDKAYFDMAYSDIRGLVAFVRQLQTLEHLKEKLFSIYIAQSGQNGNECTLYAIYDILKSVLCFRIKTDSGNVLAYPHFIDETSFIADIGSREAVEAGSTYDGEIIVSLEGGQGESHPCRITIVSIERDNGCDRITATAIIEDESVPENIKYILETHKFLMEMYNIVKASLQNPSSCIPGKVLTTSKEKGGF
jgi:hypothetical protein